MSSSTKMLKDFAMAGLTASAGGCDFEDEYRAAQKQGKADVDAVLLLPHLRWPGQDHRPGRSPTCRSSKYYDGDEWLDHAQLGRAFRQRHRQRLRHEADGSGRNLERMGAHGEGGRAGRHPGA